MADLHELEIDERGIERLKRIGQLTFGIDSNCFVQLNFEDES